MDTLNDFYNLTKKYKIKVNDSIKIKIIQCSDQIVNIINKIELAKTEMQSNLNKCGKKLKA